MEEQSWIETIDPHEFNGVVMDGKPEYIAQRICRELLEKGSIVLWQLESFSNHDHPCHSIDDSPEYLELAQLQVWKRVLNERFPDLFFVIEINPCSSMTWYQAVPGAPTEVDEEFELYSPPISIGIAELKETFGALRDGWLEGMASHHRESIARQKVRTGADGVCEKCGRAAFSVPAVSELHRGLKFMECLGCGARLLHSTRVIREVVGSL